MDPKKNDESFEFYFPFAAPGLNGGHGLIRMNRFKKKEWKDKINSQTLAQLRMRFRDEERKVVVEYCRQYKDVPMDRDNLAASAKFFLDSLTHHKVIIDDSEKYIVFKPTQEKRPKGVKLSVTRIRLYYEDQ